MLAAEAILDNSDPGFSLTGDWALGGGPEVGRNGTVYVAFGEPHLPTDVATWTFSNLNSPGRYRVSATWFTNLGFSHLFTNAAPFSVIDATAGVVRGTALVDQKEFPNDFSDAGSNWEDLGVFDITGSTMVVRLTSVSDNATYVVADAIRIERIGDLPAAAEIQVTQSGFDVSDGSGHGLETATPDDIAGLNLWLNADAGVYSDDGTTPASYGDGVYRWNDQSGQGFFAFQLSPDNRPKYVIDDGARSVVLDYWRPNNAANSRPLNLHTGYPINTRSFTAVMVVEVNTTDRLNQLISFGGFGANNFRLLVEDGVLKVFDGANTRLTGLRMPSSKCVVVWRASESGITLHLNSIANSATFPAAPAANYTGGEISGNAGGWFSVYEVALYNVDVGAAAAAQLIDYAVERYGINTSPARRIVIDGDSLSEGFGATLNQPFWQRMNWPADAEVFNHSISGQTLATASTDAAADIDPIFAQSTAEDWLFLKLGTNDYVGSGIPELLRDNLANYANARRAAGAEKVVLWTLNINATGFLAEKQDEFNELMRADFNVPTDSPYVFAAAPGVTYADYLVDTAANPLIGTESSHAEKYWLPDLYHLADGGYAVEADMIDLGLGGPSASPRVTASFGPTDFMDAVQRTFTISNSGMQPLTLSGPVTVTNPVFTVVTQPTLTALNPGQSTTFVIEMSGNLPGVHRANVRFGNSDGDEGVFDFPISGTALATRIIDDGDPEFVMSPAPGAPGGWGTIGGPGREFDYKYNRNNPGVDEFATWTFSVTPGVYRVSTTWPFGHSGFDGAAPFTIFDGTVTGGIVRGGRNINQKLDPAGTDYPAGFMFPAGTSGSTAWERIDTVNITGNTLTVLLQADDAVEFVLADSILIDRLDDLPAGPEIVVVENGRNAGGGTLNYGTTQLNHAVDKTFTITNSGTSLLNINGPISITGPNATAFQLVSGPSSTSIAPGGTSTFVVRLTAAYEGVKDATISFATNDADEGIVNLPIIAEVLNYRIIDDQDAADGFSQVGVPGSQSGISYQGDVSSANSSLVQPAASATWTFNNISPGAYYVALTWFDTSGSPSFYSSNTPVTVSDGAAVEGGFSVNQRVAPSSFAFDGASWLILGFFDFSSPTVTVTMTNLDTDGAILADGAMITRVGGGVPSGNSGGAPDAGKAEMIDLAMAGWE